MNSRPDKVGSGPGGKDRPWCHPKGRGNTPKGKGDSLDTIAKAKWRAERPAAWIDTSSEQVLEKEFIQAVLDKVKRQARKEALPPFSLRETPGCPHSTILSRESQFNAVSGV